MAEGERPLAATAAIFLMIGAGAFGLALGAYHLLLGGGNPLGGFLFLIVGIAYAYGGRALHKGEGWGWGAGVFAGAFYFLLGIFLLPWAAVGMALAAVVIVLLLLAREYYGMVRFDPKEEERRKTETKAQRMSNPEGLHCPHCGSVALWVAPDGSAFCDTCKTGTISIRPAA